MTHGPTPPRPRSDRPRRNDPCSCGSGKKLKACCFPSGAPLPFAIRQLDGDDPCPCHSGKTLRNCCEREFARKHWLPGRGHAPPGPISVEHNGKRVRVAHQRLYFRDLQETIQEFFLFVLLAVALGEEWFREQDGKGDDAHVVVQWSRDAFDLRSGTLRGIDRVEVSPGQFSAAPTGNLWALMVLAFDIYTLLHHGWLDDAMVKRLRRGDLFQGARYEVAVAAALVRAGFDIEWIDTEPVRRMPEFIATHRDTGHKLVVEAKSRHRAGVLGFTGSAVKPDELHPDVGNLLAAASLKERDGLPLVVFIDVNLPPKDRSLEDWVASLGEHVPQFAQAKDRERPDAYAAVVFTNFAWHWTGGEPAPRPEWVASFSLLSVTPLPQQLRGPLVEANREYGRLPDEGDAAS